MASEPSSMQIGRADLPDAVDLMVVCCTGLTLEAVFLAALVKRCAFDLLPVTRMAA
ncbi:hypothetical protein OH492_14265 [Vibrio chagasii]|nr:hypothetical protein [Vibrio chagasii]